MVASVIVLSVVALALGGFIGLDVLRDKRNVSDFAETPAPRVESVNDLSQNAENADAAELEAQCALEPADAEDRSAECAEIISAAKNSVSAREVDKLMDDEVAASLIEQSDGETDKTKQGIINIDVLSQCFEGGEVVTLDEIKKRVKGFNKQTTYIKVLARGTLDKALTVEADAFSLQAVKMIALTGGKAVKKR